MKPLVVFRCAVLFLFGSTLALFGADAKKPVFLYSRYFNAPGEDRYSADTTYKQVIEKLREHFEVRVDANPVTAKTLSDVRVILIANPSDKAVAGHPAP